MAIKPNIEVAALALAKSIRSTRKYRKEEMESAQAIINAIYDADQAKDIADGLKNDPKFPIPDRDDNTSPMTRLIADYGREKNAATARITNISAVRQECESAGYVDAKEKAQSAFMVEVGKFTDKIVEAERKETAEMTAKKK